MAYVMKRILTMIPVLIFLSFMVFGLIHLIPGNPAQIILGQDATPAALKSLEIQMGLNKSLSNQYLSWIGNILHGNLGVSLIDHEAVSSLILQRLPVTAELALGTIIVALVIAFPLGILAVVYKGKWGDGVALFTSTIGLSIPPFWIGIIFLLLFTVKIHLFPSSGYVPLWQAPSKNLAIMILPMVATGIREAAVLLRMISSTLSEVVDEDFVRTARSKGMSSLFVIIKHALPNALIPVITTAGLQIAGLLGGLVITEQIFSLPGFGQLLVQSVFSRDYTTVQGAALVAALLVVVVNLLVDLLYGVVDPRIRVQGGKS